MSMVKWSDFIPPEYAPVAYGLGAAAAGGGLGWLYDKLRGKKHTARRVGIGALLGLLGGAGYGQSVLNDHIKGIVAKHVNPSPDDKNGELVRIAGLLGIDTPGKSTSDLSSDIRYHLDQKKDVPKTFDNEEFEKMIEIVPSEAEDAMRKYHKFISDLQGNQVIAVPDPLRN